MVSEERGKLKLDGDLCERIERHNVLHFGS
ncbi:hypothetical protein E2C01_079088 [Portunus trituberculatus]|uniref:Uncharacterized protein n=1 Tax=Portunus trituberculatus TaxID=210409 RepID=A0A5B7IG24_PORTR|nr:hypothetical protein [Portunus trituberculatus]